MREGEKEKGREERGLWLWLWLWLWLGLSSLPLHLPMPPALSSLESQAMYSVFVHGMRRKVISCPQPLPFLFLRFFFCIFIYKFLKKKKGFQGLSFFLFLNACSPYSLSSVFVFLGFLFFVFAHQSSLTS